MKYCLLPLLIFTSLTASAHPGHGGIPDGVIHYLVTPQHAFMLLFLIVLGIYLYYRKYRSNA